LSTFTTIAEFPDLAEADIACQRLLAEGFDASLLHDIANQYARFPGVVPVRLQVPTNQVEDALNILQMAEEGELAEEVDEAAETQGDEEWAVVARFQDIGEADIACSRLRAEGFDAWLSDDTCSFMGVNESLSSKRRLLVSVPRSSLQEAAGLLAAIEQGFFEEEAVADEDEDVQPDDGSMKPETRRVNALKTVAEFMDINEADIACQRLLAEGLDASLANEDAGRYIAGTMAEIPIALQVPTEQAEKALSILQMAEDGELAE
jgi:hypothetical protein